MERSGFGIVYLMLTLQAIVLGGNGLQAQEQMQLHTLEYLIQLQGEKFDPEGIYVKEFVPELKNLPKQYIHKPWEAS